jgi:subtilisin family serine protease
VRARRRLVAAFAALAAGVLFAPFVASAPAGAAGGDPLFAQQYGPQQINAPTAWATSTGRDVVIAIVDTGVDLRHPDLAAKLVPGIDLVDDDSVPQDCPVSKDKPACGHGTHVAGIAAAATDNGVGIAGVAPDARIMPVRVLGTDGTGDTNTVGDGIRWAVDHGARVVNLSLSGQVTLLDALFGTNSLEPAISYAWSKGAVVVAAAGNLEAAGAGQPSGYSKGVKAIVVTATDRNRNHPTWANRADTDWGVAAPGDAIVSTVTGGGYAVESGTSMSTPHVSGVAAMLLAQGLSNAQVVQRILSTAHPLGPRVSDGAGLVDAAAAVGAPAKAAATPAPEPPPASAPPSTSAPRTARPAPSSTPLPAPSLDLPAGVAGPLFDGSASTSPGDVASTIPYVPPAPLPAPELVPLGESAAPVSRHDGAPRGVPVGMAVVVLGGVLLAFNRWWRRAW